MFVATLGFPGSGQSVTLPGQVSNWKALLPEHRPYETVSRSGVAHKHTIPFTSVVHLMRYPWHAISVAVSLPLDDLVLIRDAVGIHPRTPACHLETEVSKIKVLTLAFPKWYDMIRGLNPSSMLKIEHFEGAFLDPLPDNVIDYKSASAVAGE